jgi:hypothetical protein
VLAIAMRSQRFITVLKLAAQENQNNCPEQSVHGEWRTANGKKEQKIHHGDDNTQIITDKPSKRLVGKALKKRTSFFVVPTSQEIKSS